MLKLGMMVAALALSFPAWAATPTEALRADIAAQAAILTASSRLAADHTENAALMAYAASETSLTPASPGTFADAGDADGKGMRTGRSAAIADVPMSADITDPALPSRDAATATAGLATLNSLRGATFDGLFVILQRDALRQIEADCRRIIAGGDLALAGMTRERLHGVETRLEALGRV